MLQACWCGGAFCCIHCWQASWMHMCVHTHTSRGCTGNGGVSARFLSALLHQAAGGHIRLVVVHCRCMCCVLSENSGLLPLNNLPALVPGLHLSHPSRPPPLSPAEPHQMPPHTHSPDTTGSAAPACAHLETPGALRAFVCISSSSSSTTRAMTTQPPVEAGCTQCATNSMHGGRCAHLVASYSDASFHKSLQDPSK